jgi:hypothetical protein
LLGGVAVELVGNTGNIISTFWLSANGVCIVNIDKRQQLLPKDKYKNKKQGNTISSFPLAI